MERECGSSRDEFVGLGKGWLRDRERTDSVGEFGECVRT